MSSAGLKDEDIEIVTDDAPVAAPAEVVKEDAPKPPEKEPDDVDVAVAALKKQIEDERVLRIAAENNAANLAKDAQRSSEEIRSFRTREHENQFNLVTSQLESVTKETDNLEQQLAAAHTNGDYTAVAKIQRAMSRLEAKAETLEQGRAALEARKVATPDEADAQPVRQTKSLDPVADYIRDLNVSDTDKAWLDKHRDAVTDQNKFKALTATASYAINSKGITPNSAEFYSFLESELGYARPVERNDPMVVTETQRQQPSKTYSAPPSRESTLSGTKKPNPNRIYLSGEQREAAKASGLTDAEYAKNLVELAKTDASIAKTVKYAN